MILKAKLDILANDREPSLYSKQKKKNISHIARSSVLKFIHMVKLVKKNFSEKKKLLKKIWILMIFTSQDFKMKMMYKAFQKEKQIKVSEQLRALNMQIQS